MEPWLVIPADRPRSQSLVLCAIMAMLALTLIYSLGPSHQTDPSPAPAFAEK